MTKKLKAQVSIQTIYQFEFEVPDDYDKEEAGILASDYFENYPDVGDLEVGNDFQVDDVKELP